MGGIGLFGGSFDPIHLGHTFICESFYEYLNLDQIFLIPSFNAPHKAQSQISSFHHRLNMCNLAAKSLPSTQVDNIEFSLDNGGYFINVVKEYSRRYPNQSLYMLVGSDTFQNISGWYQARDMLSLITPCTVLRPTIDNKSMMKTISQLGKWQVKSIILDKVGPNISSRKIRQTITKNQDEDHLLDNRVLSYIQENRLYI